MSDSDFSPEPSPETEQLHDAGSPESASAEASSSPSPLLVTGQRSRVRQAGPWPAISGILAVALIAMGVLAIAGVFNSSPHHSGFGVPRFAESRRLAFGRQGSNGQTGLRPAGPSARPALAAVGKFRACLTKHGIAVAPSRFGIRSSAHRAQLVKAFQACQQDLPSRATAGVRAGMGGYNSSSSPGGYGGQSGNSSNGGYNGSSSPGGYGGQFGNRDNGGYNGPASAGGHDAVPPASRPAQSNRP
jgi:hypothetical protein